MAIYCKGIVYVHHNFLPFIFVTFHGKVMKHVLYQYSPYMTCGSLCAGVYLNYLDYWHISRGNLLHVHLTLFDHNILSIPRRGQETHPFAVFIILDKWLVGRASVPKVVAIYSGGIVHHISLTTNRGINLNWFEGGLHKLLFM